MWDITILNRVKKTNLIISCFYFFITAFISFFVEEYHHIFLFLSLLAISMLIINLHFKKYLIKMLNVRKIKLEKNILEKAEIKNNEYLSTISHEIRTPMNGIIGIIDLMRQNKNLNCPEVTKYIINMEYSANYMLSLLNNVLDYARIENEKMPIYFDSFSIEEVTNLVSANLKIRMNYKKINFEIKFDNIICQTINSDKLKLSQILINLISNAIKFTNENGTISLLISQYIENNQLYTKFIVSDNGIGMSEEFQNRVFKSFQQENSSTLIKYGGSGLGLAITKNYIDVLKGTISLESNVGKGSKFTIVLPTKSSDKFFNLEKKIDEIKFDNKRVLLVEDNEINQQVASEVLAILGLNVEVANNGKEAIENYAKSPLFYDEVILMDVHMPVLNGYATTSHIRKTQRKDRDLKIIAITADAFDTDIQKAFDNGMNDHISKPFKYSDLAKKLEKHLKK